MSAEAELVFPRDEYGQPVDAVRRAMRSRDRSRPRADATAASRPEHRSRLRPPKRRSVTCTARVGAQLERAEVPMFAA
jgi:hypothetical protein